MNCSRNIFFFVFSFVLCGFLTAQNNEIITYVEKTMKDRNIPGVSIAVIKNQKISFIKSFGFANLETKSGVTNQSVFQLASLTKPFTALCIMQLVEKGKVDLQSSISKYIDSLPKEYENITVHNLLNHTAGFPDQVNLEHNNSPVMDVSVKQQLEIILKKSLIFPAGHSCSYSDPGYFLLGMIIERASGLKYKQYLQKQIFEPFGMARSIVEDKWAIIENRVSPYKYMNKTVINGRRDYQHELPSHYGILSTIDDLVKWEFALRGNKIVASESKEKMFAPAVLNNGNEALTWGSSYGYGWMLGDLRGHKFAEHGGFSGTHFLHFIDKNLSVIVLTNLDVMSNSDPRSIAHNIAGMIDSDLASPVLTPDVKVPDDSAVKKLIKTFSHGLDNGIPDSLLGKQYALFLHNLPPPVFNRFVFDLKSFSEIKYLARDDLSNKNILKLGEKIKTIWHYQLKSDGTISSYAFYLTEENKIAAISKWKD